MQVGKAKERLKQPIDTLKGMNLREFDMQISHKTKKTRRVAF